MLANPCRTATDDHAWVSAIVNAAAAHCRSRAFARHSCRTRPSCRRLRHEPTIDKRCGSIQPALHQWCQARSSLRAYVRLVYTPECARKKCVSKNTTTAQCFADVSSSHAEKAITTLASRNRCTALPTL